MIDFLTVQNLELKAAIIENNEILGFQSIFTLKDGKQLSQPLGIANCFVEPIFGILKSHGYTIMENKGRKYLVMKSGMVLTAECFLKMQNSGRNVIIPLSRYDAQHQASLKASFENYLTNICGNNVNMGQGAKVVKETIPSLPPQQPSTTPVDIHGNPVDGKDAFNPQARTQAQPQAQQQPQVQPQVPQVPRVPQVQQQAPQAQAPQAQAPQGQQPVIYGMPDAEDENAFQNLGKRDPKRKYTDSPDIQVGEYGILSTLQLNVAMPAYAGLNDKGEKIWGPNKLTEEEFIARYNIRHLISEQGFHLLSDKEADKLDAMRNPQTSKTSNEGMTKEHGPVEELLRTQQLLINLITGIQKENHSVQEVQQALTKSIKEGVPFDMLAHKFDFFQMCFVDDNGEPLSGTGDFYSDYSSFVDRARRVRKGEKITETKSPRKKLNTTQSTISMPMGMPMENPFQQTQTTSTMPGESTGNAPLVQNLGAPSIKSNKPKQKGLFDFTFMIEKLISNDNQTIIGAITHIIGLIPTKDSKTGQVTGQTEINRVIFITCEGLGPKFASAPNKYEFLNADVSVEANKLVIHMDEMRLSKLSAIPTERYVTAKQAYDMLASKKIGYLLQADIKVLEKYVNQSPTAPTPQAQPQPQPQVQAQPQVQPQVQPQAQPTQQVQQATPEQAELIAKLNGVDWSTFMVVGNAPKDGKTYTLCSFKANGVSKMEFIPCDFVAQALKTALGM